MPTLIETLQAFSPLIVMLLGLGTIVRSNSHFAPSLIGPGLMPSPATIDRYKRGRAAAKILDRRFSMLGVTTAIAGAGLFWMDQGSHYPPVWAITLAATPGTVALIWITYLQIRLEREVNRDLESLMAHIDEAQAALNDLKNLRHSSNKHQTIQ